MLLMSLSALEGPGIKWLALEMKPNWSELHWAVLTEGGRSWITITTYNFCLTTATSDHQTAPLAHAIVTTHLVPKTRRDFALNMSHFGLGVLT